MEKENKASSGRRYYVPSVAALVHSILDVYFGIGQQFFGRRNPQKPPAAVKKPKERRTYSKKKKKLGRGIMESTGRTRPARHIQRYGLERAGECNQTTRVQRMPCPLSIRYVIRAGRQQACLNDVRALKHRRSCTPSPYHETKTNECRYSSRIADKCPREGSF